MTMKAKVEKLEAQAHGRKKMKLVLRRIVHDEKEIKAARQEFKNAKGKYSKLKLIQIVGVDMSMTDEEREKRQKGLKRP